MYCSKCGSPLFGASICPSCGTPVSAQPASPPMPMPAYEESAPYVEFGPQRERVSIPINTVGQGQMMQIMVQQPAYPVQLAPFVPVAPIPMPAQKPPRRQWPRAIWISALSTFLILLVIGGAGLLSYTVVVRPIMLKAQATAVAQTFLTEQAQNNSPQYIYQQATRGKPTIKDPLSDQTTSVWSNNTTPQANCAFEGGAYHVMVGTQNDYTSCSSNLSFTNFALQVQVTIFSGNYGGILFRLVAPTQDYFFGINQQGGYGFSRVGTNISTYKTLASKPASAIKTEEDRSNLLTVIALGNQFYLYINKQFMGQYTDSTYASGTLALYAESDSFPGADVAFSNLQIWKL